MVQYCTGSFIVPILYQVYTTYQTLIAYLPLLNIIFIISKNDLECHYIRVTTLTKLKRFVVVLFCFVDLMIITFLETTKFELKKSLYRHRKVRWGARVNKVEKFFQKTFFEAIFVKIFYRKSEK